MYTTYYSDGLHAEAGTREIWQTNDLLNICDADALYERICGGYR
jgi:hypothetical protein